MYSVLEYKFKYCPSINLKFIQFCFYFIVNYNITFFFHFWKTAFVMNLISYVHLYFIYMNLISYLHVLPLSSK